MGAIGDPYVSAAEIADRVPSGCSLDIQNVVQAASRTLERVVGRQFNQTETASARRFTAADWCRLPVDDFYSTNDLAVSVNGTAIDIDTVDPRPWSGVVEGQTGWPYFDLFRVGTSWPLSRRAKVTVTALWGWAAVPAPIVEATTNAALELVALSSSGQTGPVRSEAIDGYSVTFLTEKFANDQSLQSYIRTAYKRRTFGVA